MFTSIPIIFYDRKIRAALSCGSTFTKIGKDVANLAISNGCGQRRKTFEYNGGRRTIRTLIIPMGVRTGRMKPIECIIDRFAPSKGIILGLAAMKALSYRIMIDRTVAQHHGAIADQPSANDHNAEESVEVRREEEFNEGDFIEALTEAEMREMENWERDF